MCKIVVLTAQNLILITNQPWEIRIPIQKSLKFAVIWWNFVRNLFPRWLEIGIRYFPTGVWVGWSTTKILSLSEFFHFELLSWFFHEIHSLGAGWLFERFPINKRSTNIQKHPIPSILVVESYLINRKRAVVYSWSHSYWTKVPHKFLTKRFTFEITILQNHSTRFRQW